MISITDGQLYTSRRLFLDSLRPAIDSALSVSRIGSNAQCGLMKHASAGLKKAINKIRPILFCSWCSFLLIGMQEGIEVLIYLFLLFKIELLFFYF